MSKWKELVELLKSDREITQIVHWTKHRSGQTCAHRARVVRELRRRGWSAQDIAECLGLTKRQVFHLAGTNGTTTKSLSQETGVNPSAQNSSGSTVSKESE